jgi:hypothetical protein
MTNEVNDVATDINVEVEEDTNISENSEENTMSIQEKLENAEKAKSQILARAKKAEEELKALKANPQVKQNNDPQLAEELKLIARGLSDEEIEQAKIVAKGTGQSLQEAIKNPLFTIFQKDLKEKQKREDVKLGASKGSGESEEIIKGTESGSSREEHMEAFKKALGKK